MRLLLVGTISICTLLSPCLIAQRGGMPSGASGVRPVGPLTSQGMQSFTRAHGFHPGTGDHHDMGYGAGFAAWGFPAAYSAFEPWGSYYDYDRQPQVIVVALQPVEPAQPPPAPPDPPRSAVHEYNWEPAAADAAPFFSLVGKDGTVRLAIAVWVQDGTVHSTARDGTAQSMPLDAIDRDATRRANRQNRLSLWLPGDRPSAEDEGRS